MKSIKIAGLLAASVLSLGLVTGSAPVLADSDSGGSLREDRAREAYRSHKKYKKRAIRKRLKRADRKYRRKHRRAHRYDRKRHGKRHRRRHGRYSYFNDGWYYTSPWWVYPSYGYYDYGGYAPYYSNYDLHVQWCDDRYRSYNVRRDAYKGYDGLWHRCISPYS